MPAQGNALGFGIHRPLCALKGRRNPSALSGRTMIPGNDTRGVAPGWHPPRRWRDNVAVFSSGENCHKAIYETISRSHLALFTSSGTLRFSLVAGVVARLFR